jgi:hypothetical protein
MSSVPEKPGFYWLIENGESITVVELEGEKVWFIDCDGGDSIKDKRYLEAELIGPIRMPDGHVYGVTNIESHKK